MLSGYEKLNVIIQGRKKTENSDFILCLDFFKIEKVTRYCSTLFKRTIITGFSKFLY